MILPILLFSVMVILSAYVTLSAVELLRERRIVRDAFGAPTGQHEPTPWLFASTTIAVGFALWIIGGMAVGNLLVRGTF